MTIDADAHVIETEQTWEYMEGPDSKFKPLTVTALSGPDSGRRFWLIDGKIFARDGNIGKDVPEASREMLDIETRLKHMDQLEVEIQVLYPSLFLRPLTSRPEVEMALCRSYNRWLSEIWRRGEGRLRWAAVLPLLSVDNALAEARFAKENGGCALYVRGVMEDRLLSDSYFYPLYKEAARLNLPVCIHASTGSFVWNDIFEREIGFAKFKLPVVSTFHTIVYDGVPERFPKLRFGFIEVSAQWVPYVIHDLARRFERKGKRLSNDFVRAARLYVACQTDDDLGAIVQYMGEDNIVIGSDYGHADTATEIEALRRLRLKGELRAETVAKILDENPRRLYDL